MFENTLKIFLTREVGCLKDKMFLRIICGGAHNFIENLKNLHELAFEYKYINHYLCFCNV